MLSIQKYWMSVFMGVVLLSGFFGLGYYFGSKYTKSSLSPSKPVALADNQQIQQPVSSSSPVPIEEVFWIKPNSDPACPQTHMVKGTFQDNFGYYYTPDSKNYSRSRPDICFKSEAFAKDIAGFIKKY